MPRFVRAVPLGMAFLAAMGSVDVARAALPREFDVRRDEESAARLPSAQRPDDRPAGQEDDVLFRVNGDVSVPRLAQMDTVVVANGDAYISGVIHEALVVLNGDAVVYGRVEGEATVVNGTLRVRPGGVVRRASLVGSQAMVSPGASVGWIEETRMADWQRGFAWLSIFAWVSITLLVLLAGLLLVAVGHRQLEAAKQALAREPGATAIGVLVTLLLLPLLSIPLFASGLLVPVGIALLVVLLPMLLGLGYLVTGAAIGGGILARVRRRPERGRPFLAMTLGVLLLQLLSLMPLMGPIVVGLSACAGAGALLVVAWRALREPHGARLAERPTMG